MVRLILKKAKFLINNHIKLYVISICMVFLMIYSCKDNLDISLNNNLLQVNCILNAGNLAFLYVYKPGTIDSVTSRTNWYKDTTDAFQIILFKDGIRIDSLKPTTSQESVNTSDFTAKHYIGLSHIIEPGASYRIEVKKKGYSFMYAECSVPKIVKILNIDTIQSNKIDPNFYFGDDSYHFYYYKVTFADPATEINYYLLEGKEKYNNSPFRFEKDPIFEDNNKNMFALAFFSDQLINGKTYTLMARPSTQGESGGIYIKSPSEVYISLVSASQEYYNRIKSEYQYALSTYDNYAEPVQLYNNIHNGIGIFAGIAKSTDTIRIK